MVITARNFWVFCQLTLVVHIYGFLSNNFLSVASPRESLKYDEATANLEHSPNIFLSPSFHRPLKLQLENFGKQCNDNEGNFNSPVPSPLMVVGVEGEEKETETIVQQFTQMTGRAVKVLESIELPAADSGLVYVIPEAMLSGAEAEKVFGGCATVINIRLHPSKLDKSKEAQAESALKLSRYDVMVSPDDYKDGKFVAAAQCAAELQRIAEFSANPHPSPQDIQLRLGKDTFFLSLTYKDLKDALPLLDEISEGSDALELRVDILESHDMPDILSQMRILRDNSKLPIIYTVRSINQCGTFPDDPAKIFPLLEAGLRGGIEILDFETCWPEEYRSKLLTLAKEKYDPTILMPSYHVVGKKTSLGRARELFEETYHGGQVDAVKVVLTAIDPDDSWKVHGVAQDLNLPVPVIALCLGEKGQLSRVLNRRFTPVTHRSLPFTAAPGQLSASEIMQFRKDLGIIPKRNFFLLGTPISASPSPDMHNSGFKACDLPHEYGLLETEDMDKFAEAIAKEDFGGASVTIPHKQNVIPYLDEIGTAATAVGAINTIVVKYNPLTGERLLRGENTDWLGITRVISRLLKLRQPVEGPLAALVIGGGGTAMAAAYAMQQMGCKVAVYNRTPEKAITIAERFGGEALLSLEPEAVKDLFGKESVDVIVSTIPATAGFTVPDHILKAKPAVLDAAYKPPKTTLLAQAIEAGCPYAQGAEMLIEQGIEQFQFWTERLAPAEILRNAVYQKVEKI